MDDQARHAVFVPRWRSPVARYGVAFAAVVAVTVLRYPLASLLGNSVPFILYFPAVVVAGWFGGQGPGLFATVLSGYCARTWFFEPAGRFDIPDVPSGFRLLLFLLGGTLTSYLCGRLHATAATLENEKALLERKVQERTRHLELALKDMEAFSFTVSHDLRAPLRTIHGFADVIKEDHAGGLHPTVLQHLQTIQKTAARMDVLVDGLLQLAKVAQTTVELQPIALGPAVGRAVEEFLRPRWPAARVSFDRCVHSVLANDILLQHVLQNLLDNAAKYSRPGNVPEIDVRSELQGGTVRLIVADNGIGIAPADQPRLFKMFERVADASYEGVGLGLTLVGRAAAKMDGRVGVESTEGAGSRFWIDLPAASAASTSIP